MQVKASPLYPENVKFIVVHCAATPPKVNVDAKMIDRWHRERGFLKGGYHFVIKRNGVVEQGRPTDEQGAHAGPGWNNQSIGVCMAGGVDEKLQPQDNFTLDQYAALGGVVASLKLAFPSALVVGHRDLNPKKACPSFDVRTWFAETVGVQKA